MTPQRMPGLEFQARPRPELPEPLRSDVAGFIGRTKRGPVGRAVRVEGWRGYLREFGGLMNNAHLPFAVRGYFENGGQVAHVVRVAGQKTLTAQATWDVGDKLAFFDPIFAKRNSAFVYTKYRFVASSPGVWGADIVVSLRYQRDSNDQFPQLEMTIRAKDEPTETIRGLAPWVTEEDERGGRGLTMMTRVARESRLIRLEPVAGTETNPPADLNPSADLGPTHRVWPNLSLTIGESLLSTQRIPTRAEYIAAIQELGDQPEVAFTAVPDLDHDLVTAPEESSELEHARIRREIVQTLADQAADLQDRIVLVDTPGGMRSAIEAVSFANRLRDDLTHGPARRAAAIYHPWLRVSDPLNAPARPYRTIPSSGHVAGIYSRMDREHGAHHTPANASVLDAVDIENIYERADIALFHQAGVNSLLCRSGKGLMVWGGRTLDQSSEGRFVAHRRFIQRLVRSIRRVAEPLVFENNRPGLWLTLIRAVSSVLREAWEGGALRGDRVDEAFQVQCDEKTNPPESLEAGRVVCEVKVALAAPMEFITLRVALSEQGQVEVFDV